MSLERLQSYTFLKSSRFLFQFLKLPKIIGDGKNEIAIDPEFVGYVNVPKYGGGTLDLELGSMSYADIIRDITFLCESVEFPGQTLNGVDYRIPGTLKIKTPIARDYNEITASFLYPAELPVYELFNTWIWNISKKNSRNYYFDEIIGQARIFQFLDGDVGADSIDVEGFQPYNKISIQNMYPTSISPLQSNWGDDGFHRLSVTFFFEGMDITTYAQNSLGSESDKIQTRANQNAQEALRQVTRSQTLPGKTHRSGTSDIR